MNEPPIVMRYVPGSAVTLLYRTFLSGGTGLVSSRCHVPTSPAGTAGGGSTRAMTVRSAVAARYAPCPLARTVNRCFPGESQVVTRYPVLTAPDASSLASSPNANGGSRLAKTTFPSIRNSTPGKLTSPDGYAIQRVRWGRTGFPSRLDLIVNPSGIRAPAAPNGANMHPARPASSAQTVRARRRVHIES